MMYTDNGLYNPNMVRNYQQIGTPKRLGAGTVFDQTCIACGFKLINNQRPNDFVAVCYLESNGRGDPMGHTKTNVTHFCCARAGGLLRYDYMRFQAVMALQNRQIWGVSHNNRDTRSDMGNNIPIRWTMVEVIDLILAVKFYSGGNAAALGREGQGGYNIDWNAVRLRAPILRCTGKTAQHLRDKWYGRACVRTKANMIFAPGFAF
jgi:hypothetical protein